MKVQCEYDIPNDKIESLVVSCLEGGYSPWLDSFKCVSGTFRKGEDAYPWYGQTDFYEKYFEIDCVFDDPLSEDGEGNAQGKKLVTGDDFVKGLQIMASKYPHHFSDMMNDNADAITGDVFMQCVIYGEVHYG